MMYQCKSKKENAHTDEIWTVTWTKKETNLIISASVDETVSIWDPNDLAAGAKHTIKSTELSVVSADANGSGTHFVTSSMDGHIRLYDLKNNPEAISKKIDAGVDGTWPITYHPHLQLAASGTRKGSIKFYDLDKGQHCGGVVDTEQGKFSMSVAWSPDGNTVARGDFNGLVELFDVQSGKNQKRPRTVLGHNKPVRALAFSKDSRLLITASDDAHINIYDCVAGEQIASLTGHKNWVLSLAISDTQFISGGTDKTIKLWDLKQQQCVSTWTSHKDSVWGIAFNEEHDKFVTCSGDKELHLYHTV